MALASLWTTAQPTILPGPDKAWAFRLPYRTTGQLVSCCSSNFQSSVWTVGSFHDRILTRLGKILCDRLLRDPRLHMPPPSHKQHEKCNNHKQKDATQYACNNSHRIIVPTIRMRLDRACALLADITGC